MRLLLSRKNKKDIRTKLAVSEVIGTVLMLGIAASLFSVLYYNVVSTPNPIPGPIVDISGFIEDNQVILMHRGGESLNLDTNLSLNIGGILKKFNVGDLLDNKSKEDGGWSLGEKIIYPIDYDFDYSVYPNVDINVIDKGSNSIVMTGVTKIIPTCDIGVDLTVDNQNPKEYEYVIFTLTVTNYGNINASGAIIEFLLPEGLNYISCNMTQGTYNSSTGLWNVSTINVGSYATLNIKAQVLKLGYNQTTQFVVLLDGSKSIASNSWKLACNGLANAIGNQSIFPRSGSIELTIIQFGVNSVCARVEIEPVVVTESNINNIVTQITALKNKQGNGMTPIASAFYLAKDKIANSINFGGFNPNYRQVIILVTDGNANVISNPGSNCGTSSNETLGKPSAASARNYLINGLTMTEDRDEIDVIAVNPGQGTIDEQFLCDNISWPQPCYNGIPPPEDDIGWPPSGAGWYRYVQSWQEFANSINEFFGLIFSSISVKMYIKSTVFSDPKIVNDESAVVLKPLP